MDDLISRNKVLETISNIMSDTKIVHKHRALNRNIKQIPKTDTKHVAHWILKERVYCYAHGYVCSNCFKMTNNDYDFCPHCGYKMNKINNA